ncbi:MAG: DUF4397 domain-containing protein [Taibaiella sp.]|nr:DUF4397 domain-containing protein [Taibaiella sp.]
MKKIITGLLSVAVIAGMASCSKSSNSTPSNSAQVMYVNGCTGSQNVDGTSGGTKVSGAATIAYQKNSSYQSVTAGSNVALGFLLSSTQTSLASAMLSLTNGNNYSVYAGGVVTAPYVVYATDVLTSPAAGNAKVRFVNLCSDSLSVTANAGSIAIAANITRGSISDFKEIVAGSYSVKAGDPTNITTVADGGTQTFGQGKIYTVMYTGSKTGTTGAALAVTVIANN